MKIPERHSIVLSVTDSLREAILLGEFREHLPGVRKLSNDLHVSVPTILSAIHALESMDFAFMPGESFPAALASCICFHAAPPAESTGE